MSFKSVFVFLCSYIWYYEQYIVSIRPIYNITNCMCDADVNPMHCRCNVRLQAKKFLEKLTAHDKQNNFTQSQKGVYVRLLADYLRLPSSSDRDGAPADDHLQTGNVLLLAQLAYRLHLSVCSRVQNSGQPSSLFRACGVVFHSVFTQH